MAVDGGGESRRSGQQVDLASIAGRFGQLLHDAGLLVTPELSGRFAAAIDLASPIVLRELYWLGRVTLLSDSGQIGTYDRVFATVFAGVVDPAEWRGQVPPAKRASPGELPRRSGGPLATEQELTAEPSTPLTLAPDSETSSDDRREPQGVLAAMSPQERLATRDFASLNAEELARVRALAGVLAIAPPPRPSRRHVRFPTGPELDIRASLRAARRTGGDPAALLRQRQRARRRRLVLICDISGSMEPYARAYLHLLWSGVRGGRTEAFVFATRLTRLTKALRGSHPDAALERAGRAAPDWSGGTRIGEALRVFNDLYGRPGVARGAVVVILSDGWERADPGLLGREMERLGRLAYRVVWVNPRRASDRFEPRTGGMAAALPHLDALVSGHSLAALGEVIAAVGATGGAFPSRDRRGGT
ncbi:MAG: vWA domain-containing protein [Acidimicrobiales bacterium]